MHQVRRDSDERAPEKLLEDLRRDFPAEEGLEAKAAEWIEFVDGRLESISITTVRGNGVDLTFFPRTPKNLPRSTGGFAG